MLPILSVAFHERYTDENLHMQNNWLYMDITVTVFKAIRYYFSRWYLYIHDSWYWLWCIGAAFNGQAQTHVAFLQYHSLSGPQL